MRLFISDSQQRSAAAPNRLFANYSVNIIHYDLHGFCEGALDITEHIFFLLFLFFAEAKLCTCVCDSVKDKTL